MFWPLTCRHERKHPAQRVLHYRCAHRSVHSAQILLIIHLLPGEDHTTQPSSNICKHKHSKLHMKKPVITATSAQVVRTNTQPAADAQTPSGSDGAAPRSSFWKSVSDSAPLPLTPHTLTVGHRLKLDTSQQQGECGSNGLHRCTINTVLAQTDGQLIFWTSSQVCVSQMHRFLLWQKDFEGYRRIRKGLLSTRPWVLKLWDHLEILPVVQKVVSWIGQIRWVTLSP